MPEDLEQHLTQDGFLRMQKCHICGETKSVLEYGKTPRGNYKAICMLCTDEREENRLEARRLADEAIRKRHTGPKDGTVGRLLFCDLKPTSAALAKITNKTFWRRRYESR